MSLALHQSYQETDPGMSNGGALLTYFFKLLILNIELVLT